jgi:hypothetical protein
MFPATPRCFEQSHYFFKNLAEWNIKPLYNNCSSTVSPTVHEYLMLFVCFFWLWTLRTETVLSTQLKFMLRIFCFDFQRLPKYWPPTPFPPSEFVLPPHQRRGGRGYTVYTFAGRWGGGGSIFWKTPYIGLASYSIIPLHYRNTVYADHWLPVQSSELGPPLRHGSKGGDTLA